MQNNFQKTAMPTVAGIFSIVLGAFQAVGFLGLVVAGLFVAIADRRGYYYVPAELPTRSGFVVLAIIMLILAVISIIGGIFALQRRNWGLALAGAITSFLPFDLLGIVPIVLVALSKPEFDWVITPPPPPPNPPTIGPTNTA